MKRINPFAYLATIMPFRVAVMIMMIGFANIAIAASHNVKPDPFYPALVADRAEVTADKVMDGIADVTLTLHDSKANVTQRVVLQCDVTQQTITTYYYLDDLTGGKAQGATGFQVNVYDGPDDGYKANGDVKIFDSIKDKDNLRKSFDRMKKLNGVGFFSFEFYETRGGIKANPVAHSMLLSSSFLPAIFAAMDKYPDAEGCRINGGAVSVYPLKNLTDSI